MTDNQGPLTISSFARAVGLSTSVLRLYGAKGLLVPSEVEPRTGYRFYDLDQQERAVRIRRLREAGLSPDRIKSVLDSDPVRSEALMDDWVAELQSGAHAAASLVADLKRPRETRVHLDSTVLRSAIRQVLVKGDHAVLLEAGTDSVCLVSTDRHVLLARTAVPAAITGPKVRVALPVETVGTWLREPRRVELVVEAPVANGRHGRAVFVDGDGEGLLLETMPDVFPSLGALQPVGSPTGRLVFDLEDVRHIVEHCDGGTVVLVADDGRSRMGAGGHVIPGSACGDPEALEISGNHLRSIVDATVGDEIACDLHGRDRPLLWRSPAQPDFLAMLMARAT